MPLWLRKFTFHQINEFYENEAKAHQNLNREQSNVIDSDGKVNAPAFLQDNKSFKGKTGYK